MESLYDPWCNVKSRNGFAADEVASTLQKSIRRADLDTAVRFAYEMYLTSREMEDMLWTRLCVISVEDVGGGAWEAPVLVDTLNRMRSSLPLGHTDRPLFFIHAIRYLCSREKSRASDLLKNIVEEEFRQGILPKLPDVAFDMHTARGRSMGRDLAHFYQEARVVTPKAGDEASAYQEHLLRLLRQSGRL